MEVAFMEHHLTIEIEPMLSSADILPARAPRLLRRLPHFDEPHARATALLGVGAAASAAFGGLAVASARRATVKPDNKLHRKMERSLKGPAARKAESVAPAVEKAGKWRVYVPVALVTAAAVLAAPGRMPSTKRGRRVGAAAIAIIPALATAISPAFDRWLPQPPVGPRRRPVDHPVFPSGHAFRAAAVALTAGYVVVREGLVGPRIVWPLAAAGPVAAGLGRLVREKHLASDVLGGWVAGVALGTMVSGAYELARAPRRGPGILRRPR